MSEHEHELTLSGDVDIEIWCDCLYVEETTAKELWEARECYKQALEGAKTEMYNWASDGNPDRLKNTYDILEEALNHKETIMTPPKKIYIWNAEGFLLRDWYTEEPEKDSVFSTDEYIRADIVDELVDFIKVVAKEAYEDTNPLSLLETLRLSALEVLRKYEPLDPTQS